MLIYFMLDLKHSANRKHFTIVSIFLKNFQMMF